jgi:1,4-alpha-glucan branching enzyme
MMIAEESTAWPGVTRPTHVGGLGFGFKWNMGWMHDTLDYVEHDPVHRQYHHHQMTFSLMYAWSENFVLPLSHDEVVHGKGSLYAKMPGDRWKKLATLRALYAYMWAHPGKQLLFMGGEIAQEAEWSEERSLDWWALQNPDHAGVQRLVGDLNRVYRDTRALWSRDVDPGVFSWIDANDAASNVFSFLRHGDDGSALACVANFAGHPHVDYRIGLPRAGTWTEVLNTDADLYGGSGVGNFGAIEAVPEGYHGEPASATIAIPPLAVVWFSSPPRHDEAAESSSTSEALPSVPEPPSAGSSVDEASRPIRTSGPGAATPPMIRPVDPDSLEAGADPEAERPAPATGGAAESGTE